VTKCALEYMRVRLVYVYALYKLTSFTFGFGGFILPVAYAVKKSQH